MSEAVVIVTSREPITEALGDLLREAGTTGIWEVGACEWRAYFPSRNDDVARSLTSAFPEITLRWEEHAAVDWAARYQASLHPIPIGRRFVILPSPDLANPWPERMPLRLVPGMAFGTGEHFTTASCLRALEELDSVPASVLDVGCGTGILAAAAWMLGCRRVVGCDTDPIACDVSRETAEVNGTPYEIVVGGADAVEGSYDLVLANILAETLIEILPVLRLRMNAGATLIGSGILLKHGGDVLEAAQATGLTMTHQRTDGEWWTFVWTG